MLSKIIAKDTSCLVDLWLTKRTRCWYTIMVTVVIMVYQPDSFMQGTHEVWGTYVENEIICAFAQMIRREVVVTTCNSEAPMVYSGTGQHVPLSSVDVQSTPYHFWCTGGHYQAVLPLTRCSVRAASLKTPAYVESNLLQCDDIISVE